MRMTKKQFIAYRKALNKIKKDKIERLSEEEKLELKLREKMEEEKTKRLADENKRMRLIYGKIEILQPLDPGISFPEHYNYPNIKDEDIRILYIDFDYSLKPIIHIPELKAAPDPVDECPLPYMVDMNTGKIVDKIPSSPIKKIPSLPKPPSYVSSEEKAKIRKERRERRELFKKIAEGSMSNPFDPYSPYGPVVTPSPVSSLLITANNKTDVFLLSEVKEDDNDD